MYDDMGSIGTLPKGYYKELRSYGIKAVAFNPVRPRLNPKLNYRDHRKVCIIDGNVAISGGLNLADCHEWGNANDYAGGKNQPRSLSYGIRLSFNDGSILFFVITSKQKKEL